MCVAAKRPDELSLHWHDGSTPPCPGCDHCKDLRNIAALPLDLPATKLPDLAVALRPKWVAMIAQRPALSAFLRKRCPHLVDVEIDDGAPQLNVMSNDSMNYPCMVRNRCCVYRCGACVPLLPGH
jgi:hypothetical protein